VVKQQNRQPTARQKKAAQKILENTRSDKPKPVGELLVEAGYAPSTATVPSDITQSKGFIQVLEEAGVTDIKLAKVAKEGLSATKGGEPDYAVRHKYLETGVKLKGHMNAESGSGDTYNTFIGQNTINPNAPTAKEIVESTLDNLMKKTKRERGN